MDFIFDYNSNTKKVTKHWQYCVGSCHAFTALRADYMEQLEYVARELGIKRVRFHGVFDDDMNVCQTVADVIPMMNKKATKIFDFYQIGCIYDRLLKMNVQPFVELSFMPKALAVGKKSIFHYKGNVTLPKRMEEWRCLIKKFAEYLIDRYGIDEVSKWNFEVWNEPDLSCFFDGTQADYFNLYKETAVALKGVDARLKVGGPSSTCSKWLPEFITYCEKNQVPLDFISTHQYPSDALGHAYNYKKARALKKDKSGKIGDSLLKIVQPVFYDDTVVSSWEKGLMRKECQKAKSQVKNYPLLYTEWNIDSNCMATIHDTIMNSAFVTKTCIDNQGIIDGSSIWTFSDIFEEVYFFTDPFFGGFGLLNIYGIPKPCFWALKLLSKLSDERYEMPFTNDKVEIAAYKGENNSVQIMIYAQDYTCKLKKERVKFTLKNISTVKSVISEYISEESGNAVKVWQGLGAPRSLKPSQVEFIKKQSVPKTCTIQYTLCENELFFEVEIGSNEVALINISQ